MTMAQTENEIEFVELLDVPVYEDTDSQDVHIVENEGEMIVADENSQMDEVEYIQAEELDENHTIIVHDGKQYVIPTDQLQQAGNTIILEGESDENNEDNKDAVFVNNSEEENVYFGEVTSDVSQHYAVLKDGKLHINDGNSEMQDKLRDFEQSLNNLDSNEEENDDSSQEEDELLSQITGKNLLTGQKISLTGFLEKLKNKNVNPVTQSRRRSRYSPTQDYVLVPPVNRRVVVGKTPDGKKLIGRILQIQKKISSVDVQYAPKRQTPRKVRRREPEMASSAPTCSTQIPQKCSPLLDENVARTLAGLMDLETVCKSLINQRLIVRHVQRRSVGGKTLSSSRKVAYYSGKMVRNSENNWVFNADEPKEENETHSDSNIDLNVDPTDTQQLEVNISESGVVFNTRDDETDNSEPIILYLTVTQDEFGKKRTKVSIPQLANTSSCIKKPRNDENTNKSVSLNECSICNKKFQSPGSLKRHASVHDPNLRPLQCMQCLARFSDESSLKKHLVLHSRVRPHSCHVCGKGFAHRGDLNFHLRTHNPVKQFKCDICGKTFHRQSNLLRHVDIHKEAAEDAGNEAGGKGLYVCETCGCQYNYVSSLTRHIVMHHMNTDDKINE